MALTTSQLTSGKASVFDSSLADLYFNGAPRAATGRLGGAAAVSNLPHNGAPTVINGYVTVDISARNGDGASLLPQLQAAGLVEAASYAGMVSGRIRVDHLGALQAALGGGADGKADDLGFASVAQSMSFAGTVTTQADSVMHADTARSTFGVDGTGLKIGVLSDSFDTSRTASTHMSGDIATGDLPTLTTILNDFDPGGNGGTDEGRAMAQLVHDLAPGAQIMFDTAEGGQAVFAQHIIDLVNAGAKVIVDDVIYFAELAYQEGPIAQAVDYAQAHGVAYFSSAGNNGYSGQTTGYEGAWVSGGSYSGTTLMNFAPGQDYIAVTLAAQENFVLQWSNPGTSAGNGSTGATANLDMFLTDQSGNTVYATDIANEIGGDPVTAGFVKGGQGGTYYLRIGLAGGVAPSEIRLMAIANGGAVSFNSPASNTNNSTFYGHAAAAGAISVGAIPYYDPTTAEYFSTPGTDKIMFDTSGNPITAQFRGVTLSAIDGGNTTFFVSDDSDPDSYPNFYGTSAAAPDAASVALLMLQLRSTLTPDDIKYLMSDAATPVGSSLVTGAGLIDANKAAGFASTLTIANSVQPNLYGTHLADHINGGALNNVIFGGAGNDVIDGGAGTDTALYLAGRSTYTVHTAKVAGVFVTTVSGGTEGTDTVSNVEQFTFGSTTFTYTGIQQNHEQNLANSAFDDVLLQQTSTGTVYFQAMNGTPTPGGYQAVLGSAPANYKAVGTGDIDGDGRADVLVQNTSNGSVYAYENHGAGWVQSTIVGSVTSSWQFKGAGDINGDGIVDILLRDSTTGIILYRDLSHGTWNTGVNLGTGWSTIGLGDMNRDGFSDIVVQNNTNGITYYADMHNGAFTGWGLVTGAVGNPSTAWKAVGVGDINGDGYSDVVFQNQTTGQIWYVNEAGGSNSGWGVIANVPGWSVKDVADVNNDGYADVIIQNNTNGTTYWANMQGGTFHGYATVTGALGTDWHVI